MTVTYGLLDKVLKNLGLTRYEKDHQIVYSTKEIGPVVVYPERPDTEIVAPWHLSMARHSIVEMGFAEKEEFEQALERAAA